MCKKFCIESLNDELLDLMCDRLKLPELCALLIVSKAFKASASAHIEAKIRPLVKPPFKTDLKKRVRKACCYSINIKCADMKVEDLQSFPATY